CQQTDGGDNQQRAGEKAQRGAQVMAPTGQHQLQGRGQQRDENGRDGQMRTHGAPSLLSTWSLPASPRAVSSTTRNRAVVAKPMTMAVSTSACGNGSV